MHIVTLPRDSYTSSIVGEREEKRGQNHKTFLEGGNVLLHTDSFVSTNARLLPRLVQQTLFSTHVSYTHLI
jgi:hypothetical protein